MKFDEVRCGQGVTVTAHDVVATNWVGTTPCERIVHINEYAGYVSEIYDPVQDAGTIEILRDGTRNVYEEVEANLLNVGRE